MQNYFVDVSNNPNAILGKSAEGYTFIDDETKQVLFVPKEFVSHRTDIIYLILAIFFGGIGIHNFYNGQYTYGIIKLALTILSFGILSPISAVWALIEGIMMMIKQSAHNTYRFDGDGKFIPKS